MKAVLFDLDDTLYSEMAFVEGGFRNVARFLELKYGFGEEELLGRQLDILRRSGRGKIFDVLLQDLDLYADHRISLLLHLYRCHTPTLCLFDDVVPTIQDLRELGCRLGIITDGMSSVQRRKIEALRLDWLVDLIICTDELGKECQKPSPIPYRVALDILGIEAINAVYVGNDVSKDFAGPNELGMLTIQIARPAAPFSEQADVPAAFQARHTVNSLRDIIPLIGGGFIARNEHNKNQ